MIKEKFNNLINEINKIARLNVLLNKIEKFEEEYDEFIEDFYFVDWLRIATDNSTKKEQLNNTVELIQELLEEIEIAIIKAKEKLYNICISMLIYNKKDIEKILRNFGNYNDEYILNLIINFAENNFYQIDGEYLILKLDELLQGGQADDQAGL